jgi:hypothetical protein
MAAVALAEHKIETPRGVLVSADEVGELVTITFPAGVRLPMKFVRSMHWLAGEMGCGIEFIERG